MIKCEMCRTVYVGTGRQCYQCGALLPLVESAPPSSGEELVALTSPREVVAGPPDLGGWLILPLLYLFTFPLSLLVLVWVVLSSLGLDALFTLVANSPDSLEICWALMTNALLGCIACYIILGFFSKHRSVPGLMRVFLAANLLMGIVQLILSAMAPRDFYAEPRPFDPSGPRHMLLSLVLTVVWMNYFSKSKRVKETFVL